MATLNKVMLIGRLTNEPEEPRVLPNSGSTVVKFRMAVGRSKKNPQTGQWENDPNPLYIDCEVFTAAGAKRDLAGLVTKYVKRGDQLFVEGRLQLDEWEDKGGGGKRSKHKLIVDALELMGGKGDGKADDGDADESPKPQQQRPQPQKTAHRPIPQPVPDDDIPFSWAVPFVGAAMGVASLFA